MDTITQSGSYAWAIRTLVLEALLARRRKAGSDATDYNFAQKDVAQAFGRALVSDGAVLGLLINNCKAVVRANGTRALQGEELKHVKRAIEEMEHAQQRLITVGRRARARSGR